MSRGNPSGVKLAVPTSGGFSGPKSLNLQVFVMIAAIVTIMLFSTWTTDGVYLSARNISNLLRQTAITGALTVGMMFVIVSAEINPPVGSIMGLLGGVAAICDVWPGWSLPPTIIMTLVLGLPLGVWNGQWAAYRRVPSSIVTLMSMLALHGILIGVTNGMTVSPTSAVISQIGQSYLPASTGFITGALGLMAFAGWQWRGGMHRQASGLQSPVSTTVVGHQALTAIIALDAIWLLNNYRGVPTLVLLLTLLLLGGMFIATWTASGRRVYAIGGNLEAVRLPGINIERTRLAVFAISGLMVAVAGLILSSQLGTGSSSAGSIAELDAVAACVIDDTSLASGIESMAGVVVGALVIASLGNGMGVMDVPTFWQCIVKGAILLLTVWMGSATKCRS